MSNTPVFSFFKKLQPVLGCLSLALVACQAPLPVSAPQAPLAVQVPLSTLASGEQTKTNTSAKTSATSQSPVAVSPVKTSVLPADLLKALPTQVASLKLQSERSSFTAVGQSARVSLQLLDAQGKEVSSTAKLNWVSSHPERISVSSNGALSATLNALSAAGPADISVQLEGTDLKASIKIAVQAPVAESTSSSGGGGGGGGFVSTPAAGGGTAVAPAGPATESLSGSLFFDGLGLGEFKVNTFVTASQKAPQVASNSQGQFVVVWESTNQDGAGRGVYAQRFDKQGLPLGPEFRVNTTTTDEQYSPTVAMNSQGNFIVAWTAGGSQDGSNTGIFAQRYASDGSAQGTEFQINVTTAGEQTNPSIGMDDSGRFVVAYSCQNLDGDNYGIEAVRFDATGQALNNFQVNTFTAGSQSIPQADMNSSGQFVITWRSANQDGSGTGVYAQRYTAAGAAEGTEFRVNTTTQNGQLKQVVSMDSAGNFVIVWISDGQDGSSYGIYAQRYAADGSAQGSEFRVNTTTTNGQEDPAVAMDNTGNFVVTWSSNGQDGSNRGIYAQRYNAAGEAQGTEFQVNTITANEQTESAIAITATGEFQVVWEGINIDANSDGVAGKRFNAQGVAL